MRKIRIMLSAVLSVLVVMSCAIPVSAVDENETEPAVTVNTVENESEEIDEPMFVDVGGKLIPEEEYVRETEPPTEPETVKRAPVREKKDIYSTGASIDKAATGADNSATYPLRNVYRASSSSSEQSSAQVTYYSYDGGTQKTKYTFKNGDYYSGKFKKIVLTDGGITATWVVDESSLTNNANDDVGQGTGTLTITRSSSGALPEYYYGTKNGLKGTTTQVWTPWNAYRRNAADTEWVSALPHDKVTKIVLASSYTSVSNNAFRGFKGSLSNVTFNANTTVIGEYAFAGAGMKSVTWNGDKTVKEGAFYNCDSLTSLKFGSNAMTLKNPSEDSTSGTGYSVGVFQNCDALTTVNFGSQTTTIPISCFRACTNLNSITWGAVTTIKDYAFSSNEGFTTLTLNGSLKNIGTRAFYKCAGSFTRVNFRSSDLKSTGVEAFRGCENLQTADFGQYVTEISKQSFYGDTALATIVFDGNVLTTIKEEAFRGCEKLKYGKETTKVADVLYGAGTNVSSALDIDSNVVTLPYTVSTIEQGAFRNCYSLRAVTWSNLSKCTINTIRQNTFVNCIGLQYFLLPNSVITIEGGDDDNHGAFRISSTGIEIANSNAYSRFNFNIGINSANSNLAYINDNAFSRYDIMTNSSGTKLGVKFYNLISLTDTTQNKVIGADDKITFKKLKYIGYKAFFNCYSLTGILQFDEYVTIGSRSFVNTSLTDLFFKWASKRKKQDTMSSSIIGSSNQYISNNTTKGYTDSTHKPPTGYQSLYTILHGKTAAANGETTKGLFDLWEQYFKKINSANSAFSSWGGFFNTDLNYISGISSEISASLSEIIPPSRYGKTNAVMKTDPLTNNDTMSYLRTDVEWIDGSQAAARETVHFGYANQQRVDYIFIVDNSPSMEKASATLTGTDQAELADSFSYGTSNASKTMNTFSIIYDISNRVLIPDDESDNENTISIISFAGNEKNQLSNSVMTLGTEAMTSSTQVYNALFKTAPYKEGSCTNYSSGLAAAYQLISRRQQASNNKQVVILLTDGAPTYYTYNDVASASGNGFADFQTNGIDWAAAIRDDTSINTELQNGGRTESGHTIYNSSTKKYSVHSYTGSYYYQDEDGTVHQSKTYQSVDGLGVDIYGILIGSNKSDNLNMVTFADKGINTRTYTSSNMKTLASAFNSIIDESTAENYSVVIPLDSNFKYKEGSKVTLAYQIDSDSGYEYETFELESLTSSLTAASEGDDATGRVFYDSTRNAVIWHLSKTTSSNPFSTSYRVYRLTFDMDFVGGGTTVNGAQASYRFLKYEMGPYVAVNDNAGKNKAYAASYIKNSYAAAPVNGNATSNVGGAYAYIGADYGDSTASHSVARSSETNGTLMNIAAPVYLPVGELNVVKTDDDNQALSGAEFEIYQDSDGDGEFEKMTLQSSGTTDYSVNLTGVSNKSGYACTDTWTSSDNKYSLRGLAPGTYYLYESLYPSSGGVQYGSSSKNVSMTENIWTEDGRNIACFKVVIEHIPSDGVAIANQYVNEELNDTIDDGFVSIQVYNTPMEGNITGKKVDPEGNPVSGAVFALYASSSDRNADRNRLSESVSGNDGVFTFSVNNTGTFYWKEVVVPNGYTSAETAGSIYVPILDGTYTANIGEITNVPYSTVRVNVNSSDNVKSGFKFTLSSTYTVNGTTKTGYTYNATTGSTGQYTFTKIPIYYTTYNGVKYSYHKLNYTIKETGFDGGDVPSRYFTTEYGSSWSNTASASSYNIGEVRINEVKNVYVYNPSIRVIVHNFDSVNRSVPLQSGFTLNDETLRTDEDGKVQSGEWFGYGTNSLTQTDVPTGYNLLSRPQSFTINSSTSLIRRTDSATGNRYYEYNVTVYNSRSAAFPPTGSNGTAVIFLAGGAFLIISIICLKYLRKSRIREKSHNG